MKNTMNGGPKIDIATTTEVKCENEECESEYFVEAYIIRKASKLLTGAVKDKIIPIPVMRCADCGNVNEIFKPKNI
jgi:hypothetical protein